MTEQLETFLDLAVLPEEVKDLLRQARSCRFMDRREDLVELAMGGKPDVFEVVYEVGGRAVVEATVSRCRNGLAVNYPDPYMRRRDPDCMVIGDAKPTDKQRFEARFGRPFGPVREETFAWLRDQDLVVIAFLLGGASMDRGGMLVAPANAGFFVAGLADLQGVLALDALPQPFRVHTAIFLAPPFRHTHFGGRQVVVHNREDTLYEIFSYNLYPGPSAKKGVYGALLSIGETERWPTLHASTVQVVTPYDNVTTIMHEGASGSGKSEMLEYIHREEDGRILLGTNIKTGERRYLSLPRTCVLQPVTDDMALCVPPNENLGGYVLARDAEQAWFVRLNHIRRYGTDPHLERLTIHPKKPLIFLNISGVPGSTCLIWEHIEDKPGVPCPNPRVILPRDCVPGAVDGFVEVHLRNFGIRTPPCTKRKPTYGIIGMVHILPPALAWLWRLVAPRGHDNPSVTVSEALSSEGVGSYWPFASGKRVDHANLLLRQIRDNPKTRYSLTPNQHVGAWKVSFMPQWLFREYMARRGMARFKPDQVVPARCPILGYTLKAMQIEGVPIPSEFLRVEEQPEVGVDGYEAGAQILLGFFKSELEKYLTPDLDPLGRRIIDCCMQDGGVEDYEGLLGSEAVASPGSKTL